MSKHAKHFIRDVSTGNHTTTKLFEKRKREYAEKHSMPCFSNIELLAAYRELLEKKEIAPDKKLFKVLQKQKTRTLSGIASIAVLTKPWPCPGNCLYCPTEKGMPKSYFSDEPAVMRAVLTEFDPFRQVQARINALNITGHLTNKIELIVMGGTFSTLPKKYQTWFIKRCFDAANGSVEAQNVEAQNLAPLHFASLQTAQKRNESAKNRIIGLTLETRPDYITKKEILWFRELGATRVEIGVQSIYDDVLKKNRRGHSVKETIRATKLLKDAGLKINYHLMPNLYGSTIKRDLEMFETLFNNPNFKPDLIKIYPCVVTRDSDLEKLYREKKFTPYTNAQLVELIMNIKKVIPPYVRIMRLGRDIPAPDIIGGNKLSNIRQIVHQKMETEHAKCQCIRCREIRDEKIIKENIKMVRRDYNASGGTEIFLSFEDTKKDKLIALLRLRIPSLDVFIPVLKNASIIREVHTYGETLEFSDRKKRASQHVGYGKLLITEAEKITNKECNLSRITVISGIGARNYYRKIGYRLRETYMIKCLKNK